MPEVLQESMASLTNTDRRKEEGNTVSSN